MNPQLERIRDVQDILCAIEGLAGLLEQNGSKEGSEEEAQMMGRFHCGCMTTGIKHLASRASFLVDRIEEHEPSKAGDHHAN